MNIVIDSNILFSALIKDSITRKLIIEYKELFLFPEFVLEEMEKHRSELIQKSKMNENEFATLLALILKKVFIIPTKTVEPYREKAWEIVREIDENDVLFIACGLAYFPSVIWSDDKKLKKQNQVTVLNTSEIIEYLQGPQGLCSFFP